MHQQSLLSKMAELNVIQSQQLCGTRFGQDPLSAQLEGQEMGTGQNADRFIEGSQDS